MCFQQMGSPHGIPIEEDVHEKYPDQVKKAWETFDNWWQEVNSNGGPVSRSDMPSNIQDAMNIILEAPIPGYDGKTGEDSCYMVGVQSRLRD